MIAYYYDSCPNCKNHERNLVREVSLHTGLAVDERFTWALPDIWGEEAKKIGVPMPFLFDDCTHEAMHIDHTDEQMYDKIKDFLCRAENLSQGTSES